MQVESSKKCFSHFCKTFVIMKQTKFDLLTKGATRARVALTYMKKSLYIIVNPQSGGGIGARNASQTEEILDKWQIDHHFYFTEYPGHAGAIALELAQEFLLPWQKKSAEESGDDSPYFLSSASPHVPLLVVIGGDGTLHEVLNALDAAFPDVPVGYLPSGSANDFARAIALPRDLETLILQLLEAQTPREINVLCYEEGIQQASGILLNNLGVGLDASIVEAANCSHTKKRLNHFHFGSYAYKLQIFKSLFQQKSFPVLIECNGKNYSFPKAFLCTISNHPYFGGGVAILPMADPYEKKLDLALVERVAFYKIMWVMLLLLFKKQAKSRYFHHLKTTKLRLVSTIPQFVQTDGEVWSKRSLDLTFAVKSKFLWF